MQFNSLLYFTDKPSINTHKVGRDLQFSLVKQTLGLARSLEKCGKRLRVFTNTPELFQSLAVHAGCSIKITLEQLHSTLDIPKGIRFYAAHHKVCLFEVFAKESFSNCLVDVDVIANPEQLKLTTLFDSCPSIVGWVYDISDQVFPAYGTEVVQRDLLKLGVVNPFPRWYGGEFLYGDARFFGYLDGKCRQLLPRYLENLGNLQHVGDEALTTAALNDAACSVKYADAGASGLIVRHWTGKTLHVQKPHAVLHQTFLWHLPDSKALLSSFSDHGDLKTLVRGVERLQRIKKTYSTIRALVGR